MHMLNIMQYMNINLLIGVYKYLSYTIILYIILKIDQTKNETTLNKCSEDV